MKDIPEGLGSPAEMHGPKILELLEAGQLPKMVDWLDPVMLAQIGMRTIISGTLGQYADQRLIQAATDHATEEKIKERYDYSKEFAKPSAQCPIWIDYIADLGDGFEATYAMAYLMAFDTLEVQKSKSGGGTLSLDYGELLIMGGDQAYPQSSALQYQSRLIDPYNWAYFIPRRNDKDKSEREERSERKLFAIPGNHDWYDGLGAFDSLFCAARNRISRDNGKLIGGWRCKQHRSYFAIRLPHDWWIWGPDIQLAGVLDDPQRDYFALKRDQTGPESKIILCLAEPSWTHENYDNLFEITNLAQSKGGKVCAVLAGDLHHYARHVAVREVDSAGGEVKGEPPLGVQFITCGGGGAFAHATHNLKYSLDLNWPEKGVADAEESRTSSGGGQANRGGTFSKDQASALRSSDIKYKSYELQPVEIYPSRMTSRLLALKNLWLPLHNRTFALFVGLVYFLYAWVFLSTDNSLHPAAQSLWKQELTSLSQLNNTAYLNAEREKARAEALSADVKTSPAELEAARKAAENAEDAYTGIKGYFDAIERRNARVDKGERLPNPLTLLQSSDVGYLEEYNKSSIAKTFSLILDPLRTFAAAWANPAFFFMLLGLWAGLVHYVDFNWSARYGLGGILKFAVGTLHAVAHVIALLVVCAITLHVTTEAAFQTRWMHELHPDWPSWLQELSGKVWDGFIVKFSLLGPLIVIAYALISVLVGGLLGAFVFGLYWTIMSAIFAKHSDDAFGAMGLRNYKHFLRMKFEKEMLTIYPIAIDTVPGRRGWTLPSKPAKPGSHDPQIVPKADLKPYLIENPIEIDAR